MDGPYTGFLVMHMIGRMMPLVINPHSSPSSKNDTKRSVCDPFFTICTNILFHLLAVVGVAIRTNRATVL
jgi:hypothetical protein